MVANRRFAILLVLVEVVLIKLIDSIFMGHTHPDAVADTLATLRPLWPNRCVWSNRRGHILIFDT